MKKLLLFALLICGLGFKSYSQKFAYVDSEYILEQLPEYRSAQKQLDEFSEGWQKEIEKRLAEVDKLYKDYQIDRILLTDEMKKKREQEIFDKEQALQTYQKEKFDVNGELFQKRQELIKPIQDKVFDAVQKVANENALDFIFDKSGGMIMLFTNAKYDRSDEVLLELGVTPIDPNAPKDPKEDKK
jgi:outer membrane protein